MKWNKYELLLSIGSSIRDRLFFGYGIVTNYSSRVSSYWGWNGEKVRQSDGNL
ncbi:MAG: hypothetical protein SOT60_04115 [Bilifractor sp.]|nr:hypothetical protein [Bilifractor sp.]